MSSYLNCSLFRPCYWYWSWCVFCSLSSVVFLLSFIFKCCDSAQCAMLEHPFHSPPRSYLNFVYRIKFHTLKIVVVVVVAAVPRHRRIHSRLFNLLLFSRSSLCHRHMKVPLYVRWCFISIFSPRSSLLLTHSRLVWARTLTFLFASRFICQQTIVHCCTTERPT